MRRSPFKSPSPALVVACIALLVALGGSGYAAITLPRNSVGTIHLRTGAVTSLKVRNGALALVDFAPSQRARLRGRQGLQGLQGPQGSQGSQGAQGVAGAQGATGPKGDQGLKGDKGDTGSTGASGPPGLSGYTIVERTLSTTAGFLSVSVNCPSGMRALGGGGGTATPAAGVSVRNSFPLPNGGGWLVVVDAKTPGAGWSYEAQAVCATVAQ